MVFAAARGRHSAVVLVGVGVSGGVGVIVAVVLVGVGVSGGVVVGVGVGVGVGVPHLSPLEKRGVSNDLVGKS